MNLTVEMAPLSAKPLLTNLMQLYLYDFSEIDGDDVNEHGQYHYAYLDAYWIEEERFPFLIHVDGQIAGFVLVRDISAPDSERCHAVAEFFVMRKYRRRGIGQRVAHEIFDRFPYKWQVAQLTENVAAQQFWRRVIGEYTSAEYAEQAIEHDGGIEIVQEFWANATRTIR